MHTFWQQYERTEDRVFSSPLETSHTTQKPTDWHGHETLLLKRMLRLLSWLPGPCPVKPPRLNFMWGGRQGGTTRKTAPEWPPYSLSHGDPTLPSNRVASHLRLGRRLRCAAWLGVSLGLTQLPSLSVGTRGSGPMGAGGCGKKRR